MAPHERASVDRGCANCVVGDDASKRNARVDLAPRRDEEATERATTEAAKRRELINRETEFILLN
jgi:hypothetical protein